MNLSVRVDEQSSDWYSSLLTMYIWINDVVRRWQCTSARVTPFPKVGWSVSLSLSLTHRHTHTHTTRPTVQLWTFSANGDKLRTNWRFRAASHSKYWPICCHADRLASWPWALKVDGLVRLLPFVFQESSNSSKSPSTTSSLLLP